MSDSASNAEKKTDAFEELVISRHMQSIQQAEISDNFVAVNQQVGGKKSYGKSQIRSNMDEINVPAVSGIVDSDEDLDLDAYVNNKSSNIIDNNQDGTATDDYSYKAAMNMSETQVDSLVDTSYNSEDDALANKTELDAILNSNENSNDSNITAGSYQYMPIETQTSSVQLSQTSQGMMEEAVNILDSMKSPIKASSITKSLVEKVAAINMMSPNSVFNSSSKSPHLSSNRSPLASVLSPSFLGHDDDEASPVDDDLDKIYQNTTMDRNKLNLQTDIFADGNKDDDLFNDDDSADDEIFNDPEAALAYSQELLNSQHMTLDGLEEDENSMIEGRSSNESSYSSDADDNNDNKQRVITHKKSAVDIERLELEKIMQKNNEELTEIDLEREKLYKFSEEDIENLIDRQKTITSLSLRNLGVSRKDYKEQMQVLCNHSTWIVNHMRSDKWLYNELDKEFRDAKDEYNENDDGDVVVTKGYKGKFMHLRSHFYHITRESDELKKIEIFEDEITQELEEEEKFIEYVNEYNKSIEEVQPPAPNDTSMNTTTDTVGVTGDDDMIMLSDSENEDEFVEDDDVTPAPLPPAPVQPISSSSAVASAATTKNKQVIRLAGIYKTSIIDEKTKLRIKFMKSAKKSSLDKIKEQLRCGTDKQLQLKTIAFEKLRIIESIVNDRKERVIERRNTRHDIDKEIEHERILKQRERAEKKKRDNLAGNIDEEGEFDENNEIFQPLNEEEQEKLRLEYERKILEGDYMEESDEEENPEEEDEEEIPEPVDDEEEEEEEDEKSVSSNDSNKSDDSEDEPVEEETAPQYPVDMDLLDNNELLDLDDDAVDVTVKKNRVNKVSFKKGITSDDDEPNDPSAPAIASQEEGDNDELNGSDEEEVIGDINDKKKKKDKKKDKKKSKNSSYIQAVKDEMERAKREKERKGNPFTPIYLLITNLLL